MTLADLIDHNSQEAEQFQADLEAFHKSLEQAEDDIEAIKLVFAHDMLEAGIL